MGDRPRVVMTTASEMATDARICREAESLVRAGYDVTIHCLASPQPAHVDGARLVELRHRRFPDRLRLPLVFLVLLVRTAASRADIYHAHNAPSLPAAWLAARLHRGRLVYDAHELFNPGLLRAPGERMPTRTRIEAALERALAPRADVRLAASRRYAEAIGAALALPDPVAVPNYPVLPPRFDGASLRRLVGAGEGDIVVLYQGGYYLATRALDVLIKGMALLPQPYRLVLVGFGVRGEEQVLADLVQREGLGTRVTMLPAVPHQQLPRLTAGADIGVIPFRIDRAAMRLCSPNKLYEYMGAGIPVLSAAAEELAEVLAETGAGLTYDTGDPHDFARRALELGPDRAALRTIGARGRAAAESRYSWEAVEHSLLDVYPHARVRTAVA